jgi:hypothetical protein
MSADLKTSGLIQYYFIFVCPYQPIWTIIHTLIKYEYVNIDKEQWHCQNDFYTEVKLVCSVNKHKIT